LIHYENFHDYFSNRHVKMSSGARAGEGVSDGIFNIRGGISKAEWAVLR
jgi:hypothetical protein